MPTEDLFRPAAETAFRLPDGRSPRGLTTGGWVRTTGWLQVGRNPVSSVVVAALTGLVQALVAAAALVRAYPVTAGVLVLVTPVVCGGAWKLFTTRLKPASPARNTEVKQADELSPGDVVRLFGSIGPIGQVTAVEVGDEAEVDFRGGLHRSWPRDRTVQVAELLG
ncbi:hypothetical protein [Lentzea cavernae]|uniref:Uncharacterized protein n=1 Tax=Lentzea cavernae TaxID=2020703 RepID=A0ABQ3MEG8_9PSEU|nr:hypothetical protein [Lentzea cavernae]GHH39746.1 hypothetical protein GCM10017774_31870 [Lentzea cavernae]